MNWRGIFDYIDNMPDPELAAWAFGLLFVGLLLNAMRNVKQWR